MRDEGLKEFLPTLKCLVELPSAGNQAGRFLRYRGPPGDGSDGSARATATDYGGGRSGDGCRPRAVLLAPRPWDFPSHLTISTKETLLFPEERLLAWFKWKLSVMPQTLRFYPVLQRYLGIVAGRVRGLGGDPGRTPPSPSGDVPGHEPTPKPRPHKAERHEFTGKVAASPSNTR
jgi:hypothetical protein